jgi:hypothetical protein
MEKEINRQERKGREDLKGFLCVLSVLRGLKRNYS